QATNFTKYSLNRGRRQFATCRWILEERSLDCLVRASHAVILNNSEPAPTTRSLMRKCDTRMRGEVHQRFHEQRRNWLVLPHFRPVIGAVAVCLAMYSTTAPTL